MDQIILLRTDGKPGTKMDLDTYNNLKDTIIEGFLFVPVAKEQEIVNAVTKKLGNQFDGDITAHVAAILPDLLAHSYIEEVPNSDTVQYQLKMIVC